jgi:magnesium-protoporphyrin IX monomethyl ester (oxidative) cyclase
MGYFQSVLPELARQGAPYKLFYETKANLRRDQIRILAEAGVMWIQPGIEGFHDSLLRLMAKGNSAMINLQLLKYTREFGIYSTWLMLFGFPGEDDAWHAETAAWLPLVFHLQPPKCIGKVLYDRFSLYQKNPEHYGIRLRPAPAYESVYPVEMSALDDLAYFFSEVSPPGSFAPGVLALIRNVVRWSQCHRRPLKPVLTMKPAADGSIEIFDTRPCAFARRHVLTGLAAMICLAADPAATRPDLTRRIRLAHPEAKFSDEDLNAEVAGLLSLQLLLEIGHQVLALAVPGDCPPVCRPEEFPGGSTKDAGPLSAMEALDRHLAELERAGSIPKEAGQ